MYVYYTYTFIVINPCNCYTFVQTPTDWATANRNCQQSNPKATLASIDSAFENSEILTSALNQTGCSQIFIGLEEQSNNGWSWVNNDMSTYRNWRSGYPSSNSNQKCSQLNTNDGTWTNVDCASNGCYVCEIKN
uniref:C-type lectin domain-containing protein n=1 Tax=Acrobeloides nanus TaxID=290746 RepID=A0A914BXA5_9BILA